MTDAPSSLRPPHWRRIPILVGAFLRGRIDLLRSAAAYVGGVLRLMGAVVERVARSMAMQRPRMRRESLVQQMVRVGVRSVPIIVLVQLFIGVILALNMAPTLESYGQIEAVANIVAIAVFRELGALITAIVLSGYAGASIAAELGTMVEGEEIKALRAHALDPIRFLVAPRVLATSIMMVALTILADAVGVFGGFLTGVLVLDISAQNYIDNTRAILTNRDYLTGLLKAGVFGVIIAGLASYEGLNVRGGAEGVGRATTSTVVKSIVALIGADMLFTAVFYRLGW
jgi:phospholipid/cholesterol/gamma-HCH transport system permease protein